MAYSFDGTTLPYVSSAINPFVSRVPSVETPAHAGGYTGVRKTGARTATIIGTLKSADYATLKSDWSALIAAHDVTTPKQLVINDGWFFYATPDSITESEVETSNLHYQIDYKIGDPYEYNAIVNTVLLVDSAGNGPGGVTNTGTSTALPTLTVVVSSAPAGGRIIINNVQTGETTYLFPNVTGTYRLNSRIERMDLGVYSDFAGQFLTLATGANTISVLAQSGAAVSSVTIAWRNRRP